MLTFRISDWVGIAINVAVFAGIWWLNHRAAKELQRAIDDLDALGGAG